MGSRSDGAGRYASRRGESLWSSGHGRQRLGVVLRLVRRRVLRGESRKGPQGSSLGGGSCRARRLLGLAPLGAELLLPQLGASGLPRGRFRFPLRHEWALTKKKAGRP